VNVLATGHTVDYQSVLHYRRSRLHLKCDGTRAETRFRLSAKRTSPFNHLNAELNPISKLLALLGAHPILHISRIRVKSAGVSVQSTTGS
jgi:hypothetical protein